MAELQHGTISGYLNHKCRCDECKAAMSAYTKEYRAGRRIREEKPPAPIPHGTLNGYTRHRCRCDECRAASAAYARAKRAPTLSGGKPGPKPKPITHGTLAGYSKGCRCDGCRRASADYAKAKRAPLLKNRPDPEHGTLARYLSRKLRCRCDLCRPIGMEYNRVNMRESIARRRDDVNANQRTWNKANRELTRSYAKRWRDKNPGYYTAASNLRRARKAANDTRRFTADDFRRMCNQYRNRCFYCGEDRTLHMDHIIPITRGGRHAEGNIVPACQSCNSSKGNRLLIEWLALRL